MNTNAQAILTEGVQLAEGKWKKYINPLKEGYRRSHNGSEAPSNIVSTTALMLENTQKMITAMDETTRVVNLGNFVDYGFGVITAVMPALAANEIVSVQPLKGRSGEIFYLSFTAGTNKGGIAKDDKLIDPFTGAATQTHYSSEEVPTEDLGTLADTETTLEASLSFTPVAPGSVEIAVGAVQVTDDGEGKLVGTGIADTSTIDYATGKINIVLSAAASADMTASATYKFQFGNQDVNGTIPEVNIDLKSTTISTVTRSLRARWLFDAAYEMQQVHGLNADEEIGKALASEVRHEIDGEIMNDLLNQADAGAQTFTWSKTPGSGVAYVDHKDSFIDTIITMSNAIFKDTKRAEGNFIVAGINVASLIESMPGRFVPLANALKAGPHVIGTLDGRWKVIKNPFFSDNNFVVGYKGESYLEGGYVYAPYLPLYTTPGIMLDDFVNRKGVRTIYGKKMLNTKFYAKGAISN